jgi:hypothetical protein
MSENEEGVEDCSEKFSKKARKRARDMSCEELLEEINKLTDTEKKGRSGPKGLKQRWRDFKNDDEGHRKGIFDQTRSLRTYLDEYVSRDNPPCGPPPAISVELAERELPEKEVSPTTDSTAFGWGMVIYLLVSEGSRFFLPRNLIPVP